jgi:hypothetical protein
VDEERALKLEIVGPGAEPETIDAPSVLEFVAAYLQLLRKVAEHEKTQIAINGLTVRNKCVEFSVGVDDVEAAEALARKIEVYLTSPAPRPHGISTYVSRVKESVNGLPSGQQAKVQVGRSTFPFSRTDVSPVLTWSTVSMRATPIVAGGKKRNKQTCRFSSPSEHQPFSLALDSEEVARKLGALLHREVQVEARIQRDRSGAITQGSLVRFEELDDGDPFESLKLWFRGNCSGWDDVEDVDAELRRD